MPTYEYACTSCHRHFDVVQRFSDAPLETCEECGGGLKRVFHPVGIVLKGSGFYATDNRSGKKALTASTKEGGTAESSKPAADKPATTEKKKDPAPGTGAAAS